MTWNIFDWGKRKDIVGQRDALFTQAEENLRRITDRVRAEVDKAYRKLERTELMISVIKRTLFATPSCAGSRGLRLLPQSRDPVLQRSQANPQHLGGQFAIAAHVFQGEFDVSLLDFRQCLARLEY
jgi:hypothetical protein